jgi:hypothetical protein
MLTSQKSYPYKELPQGDTFRYLVLEPGADDEPLVCKLQTAPITDTHFEAVSYVWGTSIKDQPITCEDHIIHITPSLAKVLRRVRLLNKPLRVWADSVCIDQANREEKENQVALMGKIYRSAKIVLIHVGSDDDGHGPTVRSLLDEVDTMIQATCEANCMSWDDFPYPEATDPILVDPRWRALYILLKQDWFDRGWVVQEAASPPDCQILWGQTRLDWAKLMRVYIWLSTRASNVYYSYHFSDVPINCHTNVYLENHEEFGRAFYDESSWGSPSILRTLNSARELDVTDLRDRIYAFMDLPRCSEDRIILHPDYGSSHLKTYLRFAAKHIQHTRSTEILDYVSHKEQSLLDDVPSWVPRWDIPTWSVSLNVRTSNVAAPRTGFVVEPVVINDTCLRVRGVMLGTMQFASDILDWNTTTADTILEIWRHVKATSTKCPYMAFSEPCLLEAFLDSLTAGTFDGEPSQWRRSRSSFAREAQQEESQQDHRNTHNAKLSEDSMGGAENESSSLFIEHIKSRTDNRKFVLTERGYMGLAPAVVHATDLCAIVFGCKTPCALRKADEGHHYTYLGATALVGKEYGEMEDGGIVFCTVLGDEESKDWVDWHVEEQDIDLC